MMSYVLFVGSKNKHYFVIVFIVVVHINTQGIKYEYIIFCEESY